jgi:hypothetical protein
MNYFKYRNKSKSLSGRDDEGIGEVDNNISFTDTTSQAGIKIGV